MNIKRVLILSGVLALSFSMFGCGRGKWQEVKTATIEHKSNIGGFENPNFGMTVGYSGEVHYSNDGGENWEEVSDFGKSQPNQCRYASFIDENTGWLGAADYLGCTKDGGKTWIDIKLPDGCNKVLSIDLLDENQGYFY